MTRQAAALEARLKEQQLDWPAIGKELNALEEMIDRALLRATDERKTKWEKANE